MERRASVLVCDELYVTLLGKFVAKGIYTTDIGIASEGVVVPQLIFLFQIGTDVDNLFKSLKVQVTLPDQSPRTHEIPVGMFAPAPERTRWLLHFPMLVQSAVLKPGRIEVKVIHDGGEILIPAPWILLASSAPSSGA